MWASPSDYSAYRAYRYEAVGPERLAAGGRYLAEHPTGRFASEVREVVFAQAYRSASLKLGLTPGAGAVTALQP